MTGMVSALMAALRLRGRRRAHFTASGGRENTRQDGARQDGAAIRPAPLPELVVQAERIARALAAGVHRRRMAGTGEDFWQYRASQPGEPASRIDWRQSARSDQLWVREREAESPQSVALWCDASASMNWRSNPDLPVKRDRALVCALSLASALLRGGERCALLGVGAGAPGVSGAKTHGAQNNSSGTGGSGTGGAGRFASRFYTGQGMFEKFAHALAAAGTGGDAADGPTQDWPDIRALPAHAQIVLVSDFLWPEERIDAVLREVAMRPGRAHLLCVLDPAEMRLPYAGRVRFDAIEDNDSLTLPAVETLASDYEAEIARHLDVLRRHCAGTRADFALHVTNASPMPALLALHGRLSGAA